MRDVYVYTIGKFLSDVLRPLQYSPTGDDNAK